METWHPRAVRAPASRPGGDFEGVPYKICLHTTESTSPYRYDPGSFYGHQYWPHATIDSEAIHQHLPIDVSAFALYAYDRLNVVQCEIVWRAGDIENIPDATLANVADWVRWVCEQTGTPLEVCPQGFHGPDEGIVLASEFSPIRFGNGDWPDFRGWSGIYGHQHNGGGDDHWDPGRFPIERCLGIEEDELKQDEHDAVIFTGQFLEDEKQGRWVPPWAAGLKDSVDTIKADVAKLKAGGGTVDVDALAEKVADKLAERLKA